MSFIDIGLDFMTRINIIKVITRAALSPALGKVLGTPWKTCEINLVYVCGRGEQQESFL